MLILISGTVLGLSMNSEELILKLHTLVFRTTRLHTTLIIKPYLHAVLRFGPKQRRLSVACDSDLELMSVFLV